MHKYAYRIDVHMWIYMWRAHVLKNFIRLAWLEHYLTIYQEGAVDILDLVQKLRKDSFHLRGDYPNVIF